MIAFGYYLLKVMLCSGILYGYYWLALRNRVFHQWNRYYLLGTLVLSIALPLVKIPVQVDPAGVQQQAIQILNVVSSSDDYVESLGVTATAINLPELFLSLGYGLICLLFLVGLIRGLMSIRQLVTQNPVFLFDQFTLVDTTEQKAPFSFLRYVFWRREIPIDSETGQQILRHEIAHIREQHSLDKLFIQFILVFYWMNPIFWLIRKEMGIIHEFVADRQSVAEGDTAAFAAMMLQSAYPGRSFGLSNPFFHSPIQRRMHMLLKTRHTKVSYFTRIMALPLLGLIGLAFTVRTIQISQSEFTTPLSLDQTLTVVIDAGHGGDDAGVLSESGLTEKDLTLAIALRIKALNTDPKLKLVLLRESDQRIDVRNRVDQSIAVKPDAYVSLHVNGSLGKTGQQRRGLEVYIPQVDDAKSEESRILGSALQQALAGTFVVAGDIKKRETQKIHVLDAPVDRYPRVLLELGYLSNPADYALLVNDKKIDQIARQILEGLKNFGGRKLAATSFSGKIHSNSPDASPAVLRLRDTGIISVGHTTLSMTSSTPWELENSLVIINGKRTDMYGILNKQIEADSVIFYPEDNPTALKRYGVAAKKGVLVLLNAKVSDKPIEEQEQPEVRLKRTANNTDTTIKGLRPAGQDPLYVLDDMIISRAAQRDVLSTLVKPDDIERIDVLNSMDALSRFGEDAKDGAVLITTKKHSSSRASLPDDINDKVVLTGITVNDNTPVFTKVDVAAGFPGGQSALKAWLREQLDNQPSVQHNPAKFKGLTGLRFIVNSVGQVTNVTLLERSDKPYNAPLGTMVSALLQKGPYWTPARQNGEKVRSFVDIEFTY